MHTMLSLSIHMCLYFPSWAAFTVVHPEFKNINGGLLRCFISFRSISGFLCSHEVWLASAKQVTPLLLQPSLETFSPKTQGPLCCLFSTLQFLLAGR